MANKRTQSISPTFAVSLTIFTCVLLFVCYYLASETGLIPKKSTQVPVVTQLDTNQILLLEKDSIIRIKDLKISELETKLAKKPDTVYLRPKPVIKKTDTLIVKTKTDSIK